jgi:hypothetical protein
MKNKIIGMLVCTLIIAATVSPLVGAFGINRESKIGFQSKTALISRPTYIPEDIDLRDATFHRSHGRYRCEWWYFEGIFDNGYSVVVDVFICSKGDDGLCKLKLNIFNDAESVVFLREILPLSKLEASEDVPNIKVSGKQIIEFDLERYNSTGEWVYNVSMEIDSQEANLQFIGTTQGWKGESLRGWYGPVLPKATVEGTLIMNGEEINVSGLGYHEHAWGITMPVWEWGWYWGKIVSDSFSMLWAKMMQTRNIEKQRFAIFSQDQSGYININPENIEFEATNYVFDKMRLIPTKFMLNVTDPDKSICINVTMESINIQHMRFGVIRYFRYHVKVNGQISYGSSTEMIKDEIQIIELVRFR